MDRWEQAARYLGTPDARVETMMQRAFAALDAAAQPRTLAIELPCAATGEETTLGSITLRSRDLARTLAHSPRALLYAATLGVQADALITRAQLTDMAYALTLQACAAAAVEALTDRLRA
ncbi:MAG: Vitamin B12 dependent methionine synthase activation subunit, partial [Candidatus Spyradocola sp.]